MNWSILKKGTAEDAAQTFLSHLWVLLCRHIPFSETFHEKRSHPWLNDRCEKAIQKKNAAENSEDFHMKRDECSKILKEEYQAYLHNLKSKIAELPKGSKRWWKLNRQLLERKQKISSILKNLKF